MFLKCSSVEHLFRYTKKQAAVWTQVIFKAFGQTFGHSADDTDIGGNVKD